ncbi:U3 small nucleolar RNA-associated protein 14 A [Cichlidogyrus casuarinus]|uniref:U3 small nucleolar RNA-associated protein 14 A n=1 Tax=Cichlidogyrus casuarinus TaxID=1844966 RepID=A0ABD2Q576_9PLAT
MDLPAESKADMFKLASLKKGSKTKVSQKISNLRKASKNIKIKSSLENEKDKRRVHFNASRYRMNLWKNPVHHQRLSNNLVFPLNNNAVEQYNSETSKLLKQDQAIDQLMNNSSKTCKDLYNSIFPSRPNRTPEEMSAHLTLEQQKQLAVTLAKRADVAERDRMRNEYIARKLARQKRIKSKNFHKHLKKRQMKEYEKQTEYLRTSDPKAFAERLLEAEKQRAQERISQKHKLGSKFAKNQKLRAKYDKEARDAVSAMHDQHKDLLAKTHAESDSEDSDIDLSSSDSDNDSSASDSDQMDEEEVAESQHLKSVQWWRQAEAQKPQTTINRPHVFSTLNMDGVLEAEFAEEKGQVEEEEAPKDVDTYLPGWNAWTGPGTELEDEERRRKRLIKAPKRLRKDAKRNKVIIRERVNESLRKHLVKCIPFPYNSPEQFEATLKHPVGREWNTETSFRQQIRPRVVVQKGKIIQPLDANATFLREKDVERLARNKKLLD